MQITKMLCQRDIDYINLSEQVINNQKLEISINFEIPSTRKLDKKTNKQT